MTTEQIPPYVDISTFHPITQFYTDSGQLVMIMNDGELYLFYPESDAFIYDGQVRKLTSLKATWEQYCSENKGDPNVK